MYEQRDLAHVISALWAPGFSSVSQGRSQRGWWGQLSGTTETFQPCLAFLVAERPLSILELISIFEF